MNTSSKAANIVGYKPFYIQRDNQLKADDTKSAWGMIAKSNPYPALPNPKDPYKNNWLDRDGEDEYTREMFYEPMTIEVEFYAKAVGSSAAETLRGWMDDFFEHIRNGEFKIYDSYTALGFGGVRYAGYKEGSYKARNGWASAMFTVSFKINAPATHLSFTNGRIQ